MGNGDLKGQLKEAEVEHDEALAELEKVTTAWSTSTTTVNQTFPLQQQYRGTVDALTVKIGRLREKRSMLSAQIEAREATNKYEMQVAEQRDWVREQRAWMVMVVALSIVSILFSIFK